METLGLPPSPLSSLSGGPSAQGPTNIMDMDTEVAAIEVLRLLDGNRRQGSMSTAEAILLASDAGQTALHLSASLCFGRLSTELIVRGVGPNQRDVNGYIALHFAVLFGHTDCARILVQEGAHPGIVNLEERTAKEIALDYNSYAIEELLDPRMTDMSGEMVVGSQRGHREDHAFPGTMVLESDKPTIASLLPRSDQRGAMSK